MRGDEVVDQSGHPLASRSSVETGGMDVDSLLQKEKRRSQRIPVELTVLGEVEDRRIAMCSDNVSLEGMFLFSREFIRPRAVISAKVWISNEQEPLQMYLTSCFTERTWTGYGIGVYISGISDADRSRWEEFYRSCAAARSDQLRQVLQSERTVRDRRVLVLEGSLSPQAMQALSRQGLEITQTPSIAQALEVIQNESFDVVISDLQRPGLDGLALCSYVNGERLPIRTVLLTNSAVSKEFLIGLYAGATRVIAKPCSNELLISRILEVLQQRLPGGRATSPGPGAGEVEGRRQLPASEAEASPEAPSQSKRQVAARATQYLGEVYRYVHDRFARR